jgi:CubicO group peptidase (beta-lactamase class C family)
MKNIIGILIILSFFGCKTRNECTYQKPVDINDGLSVSTLEKHNLDTVIFNKINQDLCGNKYGKIHSLLVIVDNDLVIEQYYNNWKQDQLHFLASNTKSFNSILIGIAIDQAKIKDVNQKMLSYFPDYEKKEKDSLKHKITIKNLLTMTSGFKWDEQSLPINDPNNMGVKMDNKENWLKESLELPMDAIPGTKYVYCGPNAIILGEIIRKATGQNIADFAETCLFKPLGIKEYDWFSKNGIFDCGGGLKLRSRDIAKYGLLHLNLGKWGDTVIVSKKWIVETSQPFIEINHPFYSCYQWQMIKTEFGFNAWFIPGNGGQIISIIPNLNMVVIINADNRNIPKNKRLPLENLMNDLIKMHPKLKKEGSYNIGL